jgi:hypothetical protein
MTARTQTTAPASKLNGHKVKASVTTPVADDEPAFSLREFAASMGIEIPSGRRLLVGFLTQLAVGVVGGYAVGTVASYAMVGAVLFTGSMFLAWCAFILALIVGAYAVMIAASRTGQYVAGGKLEAHAAAAKSWVTGLFTKPATKLAKA